MLELIVKPKINKEELMERAYEDVRLYYQACKKEGPEYDGCTWDIWELEDSLKQLGSLIERYESLHN